MTRPSSPGPLGLFRFLTRLLLPADFREQVGAEQISAFEDAWHAADTRANRLRLWCRELGGLARAAWRERLENHRSRERVVTTARYQSHQNEDRAMFGTLKRDLAYAFRVIKRTPILSTITVLSLAVGVSVNTTVFSVLNAWLLRPLPYEDVDRLVMLFENNRNDPDDTDRVAPANYFDWVSQTTAFQHIAASRFELANLTGVGRPEQLTVSVVTPNLFEMLGTEALLGRTFLPGDADNGGSVCVTSEGLWRNRFGADPAFTGKTLTLDGTTCSVVGVIPDRFDFLVGSVDVWTASDLRDVRADRTNRSLLVTARLRDGVTVAQARSELSATASRLETLYPETNRDWGTNVQLVRAVFPGPTDRGLINILMTVVVLVLIVACANIAGLLMAKTEARQKEIAIRTALGAGKRRILRQLLTESVVLALCGGMLGLVLSMWGIRAVVGALPDEIPAFFVPDMNLTVLGFGIAVSVLAGLTFGITPAVQAIGGDLKSPLMEGGRGGTASRRKKRVRHLFVVIEFAIALSVLMGAAVLTDVFKRRLSIDLGFDATNVLTAELSLPEYQYADPETIVTFTDELERRLADLPGSTAMAITTVLPRARSIPFSPFTIVGEPAEPNREPETAWLAVSPTYFDAMGITIPSGRAFSARDRADGAAVVIVNQRLADLYFDGINPTGERISIAGETREIIGVAGNIAQQRLTGLMPDVPSVYFPLAQRPVRQLRVVMRSAGDPRQLAEPIQDAVWAIDPDQPITAFQTMDELVAAALAGPNVMAQILFVVGILALSLSAVGIYGVMAYAVAQQTSEIGIRMALGASRSTVMSRIAGQGATLAGVGLVLGIPLSAIVTVLISNILSRGASADGIGDVQVLTVGPMLTVAGILIAVALLASYLPARRAIKIDPVVALQSE